VIMHWAKELIGQPHTPQRNCWWLVRHVFRTQLGIEMPHVDVEQQDTPENVAAIKRASEASGWRPAAMPLQAWDIVLMQGPTGRHVGVMVEANGRLGLLHNVEGMGVCFHTLEEVGRLGYSRFEPWRRDAGVCT